MTCSAVMSFNSFSCYGSVVDKAYFPVSVMLLFLLPMIHGFASSFQNGPSDYLKIGPVKTELAHIHPTVYIYHDVLSDYEISVIKELATPMVSLSFHCS